MSLTWIIDNGHGGIKDGAYTTLTKHKKSPKFSNGYVLYEGEWTRRVTAVLMNKCHMEGISVINLVPEIDDISLAVRIQRTEIKMDNLFLLSIHMNGTDEYFTTEKSGLTTFYYRYNIGRKYAYIFQDHVGDVIGNRGIFEKAFKMLNKVKIPALLLECGFMNNIKDVEYLKTDIGIDELTSGIIKGMKKVEEIY
jgi:N-acetylmuramoyl-L-alanine amidase